MKKLTLPQLLILNTCWIGISFLWNTLHPIILPAVLINFVPDTQKNTWLGMLTFIGLIVAMIVQPLSGALSDGWHSRWGRRRPLIVIGTLFDLVFLTILGRAGGLTWLFIGYIGLQFSSNIAHGPMQGLLPDHVPQSQLGVASSLKTLMDMSTLIVASLLAGRLMDASTRDATLVLGVVMGVLSVSTSITVLGIRETPSFSSASSSLAEIRHMFRIDFQKHTAYWWLIAERALFLLGIYGVQAFAQYYLQDVLRVPDPPRQTGDLLASITVGLVILVIIGGWLTDRFGAKKVLYAASAIAAIGMFLMLLARDTPTLTLFGLILGGGIGLFLTSNWALANVLVPKEEAGKFLGLTNLATAGSGALARLEGPAIDALNAVATGRWWGYTALFLFGTTCIIASLFLLKQIDETH